MGPEYGLKVRNLAVFDELEIMWQGYNCDQMYDDYEGWLADLFKNFSCLDKFTVVFGRLHEPDEELRVVFKDPITLKQSHVNYDLSFVTDTSYNDLHAGLRFFDEFILEDKPPVDLEKVKKWLTTSLTSGDPLPSLPAIDCQIVTSSR